MEQYRVGRLAKRDRHLGSYRSHLQVRGPIDATPSF
jgi:hypothetical protein